jgi:hypothetical protein
MNAALASRLTGNMKFGIGNQLSAVNGTIKPKPKSLLSNVAQKYDGGSKTFLSFLPKK